jgi:hypothetical protein
MKLIWAWIALALSANSAMAEEVHRNKTVQSGNEKYLGAVWRTDKNCEPKEVLSENLLLEKVPEHGYVCYRRENVEIRNADDEAKRHCVGRQTPGEKIIYRSWAGYSGPDELRYVILKRHASNKNILVDLTVTPAANQPRGAQEDEKPQSPGPIPECAAFVS